MDDGFRSSHDYDHARTLSHVPTTTVASAARPTAEFVGASDETIGEAVRRALARAAQALRTLEGVGVLIVPHIRQGNAPRFRVTLKVTTPVDGRRAPAAPRANGVTRTNGVS